MSLPKVQMMEAQAEFIQDTSTKFLGFMGSYRAGKTLAACYKAIQLSALNVGYDGLMTEPTMEMVSTILIPQMREALETVGFIEGKTYECYKNNVNPRFEIKFPGGDVTIYLKASENYERIRGFSVAFFIADEFDTSGYEICHQAWQKMVARLTKGNCIQGCVTSTKEGYQWAYKYFVEQAGPDRRMIDVFVRDNPFIDEGYIETLKAQLSPKQFEAYINNEFINFTDGRVYYCYDRDENRTPFTLEQKPNEYLFIGVDFNVGKMAAIVALMNNDRIFVVDELWGAVNTMALALEIKKKYPGRYIELYVDTSGYAEKTNASQTDIAILRQNFGDKQVFAYKKHLTVADRVGSVNARFLAADGATRKLFVNDLKCPKLVKGLEGQGYDKSGKPDKANDLDHMVDALGYLVSHKFPIKSRTPVATILQG